MIFITAFLNWFSKSRQSI